MYTQLDISKAIGRYLKVVAGDARPRFRSLDLTARIAQARSLLSDCRLCEHACGIDRESGAVGVCGASHEMAVASAFAHHGEEPFLVPSYTIFFYGCTFDCVFCQNWDIARTPPSQAGDIVSPPTLARAIDANSHCRNVNFVGGEPTPYLPMILETLSQMRIDLPVVWNSNFYMSEASMALLSGAVDIYLSDFKYGNDACAKALSGIDDYGEIVRRNHTLAGDDAELVIRHLVLPDHVDCCTAPILRWLAEQFGDRVIVNLMDQYRPSHRAANKPPLDRRITPSEFKKATQLADEFGLHYMA